MATIRSKPQVEYTKLFINNEWCDSKSGKTFEVINPATEEVVARVQEAGKEDVDAAVAAARKAFEFGSKWRRTDASERGRLLHKLADLWERDFEQLCKLETLEVGKTYGEVDGALRFSIDVLRYYAGWCDKITGQTIPVDGDFFTFTRREPVGVCGLIVPWNYPLVLLAWKWGPALACGCTIVLKPDEHTPLAALHAATLAKEAGFPPGVINVVPGGPAAGEAVSSHMDIDKVAFTGSTEVGRKVMAAAAESNLKRCSLELGGKSPIVVFEDCDLDEAVTWCHNSIMGNQGQSCCAGSRNFVHEKIYDEFVKRAKVAAEKKKIGDPFNSESQGAALISDSQFEKVLAYIDSGKKQGATLVTGGSRIGNKGYFVQPTVFSDVTDDMKIAKEEIFGPVQSILKFSTMEEVVKRANNTHYGLASGVMTKDIDKAMMFAQASQAGMVWVNCPDHKSSHTPFGGFKQPGLGIAGHTRNTGQMHLFEVLINTGIDNGPTF